MPAMAADEADASRFAVLALVSGLAVAGLALTSCRSGDPVAGSGPATIDRSTFAARVIEREKVTEQQAQCVTDYVFAGYQAEDIRVIYEQDFTILPSSKWGEYGHALVGCTLHDELVGGTTGVPGSTAVPGATAAR